MHSKWPFQALISCSPWVGLTLESMSSTMPRGGRRPCTRSIHWPDRSVSAERFFVCCKPVRLEAAHLAWRSRTALTPPCRRRSSASPDHGAAVRRRSRPRSRQADRTPTAAANRPAHGGRSCRCAHRRASRLPSRSAQARRRVRDRRAIPASEVTPEPRNCSFRRRSKSSRRAPDSDSPAGCAIAASRDPDKLLIAISKSRKPAKISASSGECGLKWSVGHPAVRARRASCLGSTPGRQSRPLWH